MQLDGEFHSPRFVDIDQREFTRAELVCRGNHHHNLPWRLGEVDDVTLVAVRGGVGVIGVGVVSRRSGVVMKR